jgi:hypothetical protein
VLAKNDFYKQFLNNSFAIIFVTTFVLIKRSQVLEIASKSYGPLGLVVGMLALIVPVNEFNPTLKIALAIVIVFLLVIYVFEIVRHCKTRPKKYQPNSQDISEYMYRWLNSGGLAAVFSRDLTWVESNAKIEELLLQKSKRNELILYVHKETEIVKKLKENGAVCYTYPSGYTPNIRFTVIDYGKAGSRVAIGVQENGIHIIREYQMLDFPVANLVKDLIELGAKRGRAIK